MKRLLVFGLVFMLFFGTIATVSAQTSISGSSPNGTVYKQDEKIFIVNHNGLSFYEEFDDAFYASSVIYGDLVNVSDDTVYYIIVRGNVYNNGEMFEKTGYGQKYTFRHNYSVTDGNPIELAISPFKMTLHPGESAPFSLRPGQSGWDCYEVWIESYKLENSDEGISDEVLRNDMIIKEGKLDNRGTYKGKVSNPTEKAINNAYVILVKYNEKNEIFAIKGESLGSMSSGQTKTFTIPTYLPGMSIKTHADNFIYGEPHHVEVLAWGYTDDRSQVKTSMGYPGDLLLFSESLYYPNNTLASYMDLDELKLKAADSYNDSPVSNFCSNIKEVEPVIVKSTISIPSWIKQNAGWWAMGEIDDKSFLTGIQYLINQKIMKIDTPEKTADSKYSSGIDESVPEIPQWVKNNAGWWANGEIDDASFVSGIEFMVSDGIIVIK